MTAADMRISAELFKMNTNTYSGTFQLMYSFLKKNCMSIIMVWGSQTALKYCYNDI